MYLYGKYPDYDILNIVQEDLDKLPSLLNFAEKYSICGNVWEAFVAYLIMIDENPFSLSVERNNKVGSAESFAKCDIEEFRKIFHTDFSSIKLLSVLLNYSSNTISVGSEDIRKGKLIIEFAKKLKSATTSDEFFNEVKKFYVTHGVGVFGLNKAFYMRDNGEVVPVSNIKNAYFDKICGYDSQKMRLIENTNAFINSLGGNNVLLYGDSGTGKSTSIKAVLNMFFEQGLRMIQIQKHQFVRLGELTEKLNSRNYKFILYMDDLSFEDFEIEYKYLKAAIEGGLGEKPDNVLIYATSNRRHIIKETFAEREGGGDIHRNESIQEKISLSERFGLMIYYPKPNQQEFFDIVMSLAKIEDIKLDENIIISEARKWGISHSGFSGRTAEQFIAHLKTKK